MVSGPGKGMMVVMPGLAEREQDKPGDIGGVVVGVNASTCPKKCQTELTDQVMWWTRKIRTSRPR